MSERMQTSGASEHGPGGGTGDPPGPAAGGDFAALAPDLTRRIEAILDTVQLEADKLLDEARDEAQRRVEGGRHEADELLAERRRRIAALSDTLVERTEAVVAQLQETELVRASFGRLMAALSEAADRIAREVEEAPGPPPAGPPDPGPLNPPPGPPADRAWVEARQAAIQMAAAGNTRAQVEAHLRGFLAVPDPVPLLDQVFGTATLGEARVPWAIAPATRPSEGTGG